MRLFSATQPWFGFGEHDVWTCFHSAAFDFSVWEIWGALLHGGRLVMVPYLVSRDPDAFHALLRRERVTVLNQTPSAFGQLIAADARVDTAALRWLRLVIFGGEVLEMQSLRPWFDRHGDAQPQLVNMYGITETTVHVTYRPVRRADLDASTGSMIGEPIPDLRVYLLDRHLQPVPIGVPGEIVVGGAGVARGYLNRPELTAERFVPDPFSERPAARMYRSGDLARRTATGDMEYLGRIDQQVKLRGFRIELGEIESALARHPHVCQAVVLLREDTPGDPRLVAYVVTDGNPPIPGDLRAALKEHLPDHMIPASFVQLPNLPLTPNGKIDRKALPVPEHGNGGVGYCPPRSPVEKVIADIWAEVLNLPRVGIDDNFFDLGGHSLLAMQLRARLRDIFGVELPVRALFESPTIAEQAALVARERPDADGSALQQILEELERMTDEEAAAALADHARLAGGDGAGGPRCAIADASDDEVPPVSATRRTMALSFAQQGLWFLERLMPGGTAYNIPLALRLEGALDPMALEASLNAIVARHEALRTTCTECGGNPVQVVAPSLRLALAAEDLGALPEEQREAEAQRRAQEMAGAPFSLKRGPLIRARLLRLDKQVHVLVLVIHHIVADGWSMSVMLRELAALYPTFTRGQIPNLEPLPVQYADYAVRQRQWLQGDALKRQVDYWVERLAQAPLLRLPTDSVRTGTRHAAAQERLQLPAALTDALRQLSQREGVTPFMTLLAAFQLLLSRHSGQDDVVVGAPIAGRMQRETEGLIGLFVNTLVLRTDISGNPRFSELLQRVREVCLGAYTHQDLPFEKLVEALNPTRDLDRNPLVDVMLDQVEPYEQALKIDGLRCTSLRLDATSPKFAMTLYVCMSGSDIGFDLVYQDALFSRERMAEFLRQYHRLLTQIVKAPEQPILSYSLVTPTARSRLPDPSAAIDEPRQVPVAELVADWADRQPDSIAVTQGTRQWSYRVLADAANRLARALRRAGIGRGDVVAIVGSRSFGLVSSMLGTWLSGGTFLTIDGALPEARRRVMLREARAKAICRVGAAPLPEGWSQTASSARVFDIDPHHGIDIPADLAQSPDAAPLPEIQGRRSGVHLLHLGQHRCAERRSWLPQGPQPFPRLAAADLRHRPAGPRGAVDQPVVRCAVAGRVPSADQRGNAVPSRRRRSGESSCVARARASDRAARGSDTVAKLAGGRRVRERPVRVAMAVPGWRAPFRRTGAGMARAVRQSRRDRQSVRAHGNDAGQVFPSCPRRDSAWFAAGRRGAAADPGSGAQRRGTTVRHRRAG